MPKLCSGDKPISAAVQAFKLAQNSPLVRSAMTAIRRSRALGFGRQIVAAFLVFFLAMNLVTSQFAWSDSSSCESLFSRSQTSTVQGTTDAQLNLTVDGKPKLLDRILFWGTLGATTMTPYLAALAGGFSGRGGGGGVAVFNNSREAGIAQALIAQGRPLPESLLARAQIKTLERWEMEKNGIAPMRIESNSDWRTILDQAKANLRLVSPVTARHLDEVSKWMAFADWEAVDALPRHLDTSPNQPLSNRDVPIQLAIRLSDGNNERSQGPARSRVRLRVIFNQKLFDRLDPFDQAMLVLHEELYALGQAVGQNTSDHVRPLNQFFFSQQAEDVRARTRGGLTMESLVPFFKTRLLEHFGDYAIFFADHVPRTRGEPRSADRHFAVFVDLITELRELMGRCSRLGLAQNVCAQRSMNELSVRPGLTEEQAFVFMSYFFLEKTVNALNSEVLMDNRRSPEDYQSALQFACVTLLERSNQLRDDIPTVALALRYCR